MNPQGSASYSFALSPLPKGDSFAELFDKILQKQTRNVNSPYFTDLPTCRRTDAVHHSC